MVHKSAHRPQKLFHSCNWVSTETLDSTHDQSRLSWSIFVISRYPIYRISLIRHCGYNFLYCCSFLCGYYSRVATIWRWHLFLWKAHGCQRWLNKERNTARPRGMEPPVLLVRHSTSTLQRLLDAGTSMRSFSVLLSAIETSRKTHKQPLALTQWLLSAIICTQACVLHILAVAILYKGGIYSAQSFRLCAYYIQRILTIQGWYLIKDVWYTNLVVIWSPISGSHG